jgi:hypothetical protein
LAVLSRIAAAAQFRGFGRTTLAYYFFRFVSWPQLDCFEDMPSTAYSGGWAEIAYSVRRLKIAA